MSPHSTGSARWLPMLTAISANSPFWQGQDTGYASYRSIAWGTVADRRPDGDLR